MFLSTPSTQGDNRLETAARSGPTPAVHSAAISMFRNHILHWIPAPTPSVNTLLNILLCVCVCVQEAPLHEELHPSEPVCVVHAASRGRAGQRLAALPGRRNDRLQRAALAGETCT